ncbi:MAG: hypothetical protein Q9195_009082 [Heterodermia aff. obscurata]
MGKKAATKKSSAVEATATSDDGPRHDNITLPPSPDPTTCSQGDADPDQEEDGEQCAPSKQKKAPVADMAGKPSTSTPSKASGCATKETKKAPKKVGSMDNSTALPVPPPVVRPASAKEARAFTSPIFTIFVGPFKQLFAAHQAIISQSPVLEKKCTEQSAKKGRARTCFILPREKPANFAALLQYLYSGQVYLNIPFSPDGGLVVDEAADDEAIVRAAKKIARLYAIGTDYELEELQAGVTNVLKKTKLIEKLPGMDFFELAEKLYADDPDLEEGEGFAKFFAEYAPDKVRSVPVERTNELLRMVSNGGAFAEAIFLAYNIAVRAAVVAANELKVERDVKPESPKEEQKEKRAREEGNDVGNEDGKNEGKEDKRVDKRAREESDDVGNGDGKDEGNEDKHVDKRTRCGDEVPEKSAVPGESAVAEET